MPTYIVKMADDQDRPWYFFWSSIVDAPVSHAMTLDELRAYYRDEHGRRGMDGLADRLRRVEATGTSCRYPNSTAESTIESCNRAGKGETWLTAEQQLRLVIAWRDDPEAEIEGVDQDMVHVRQADPYRSELQRLADNQDLQQQEQHRNVENQET